MSHTGGCSCVEQSVVIFLLCKEWRRGLSAAAYDWARYARIRLREWDSFGFHFCTCDLSELVVCVYLNVVSLLRCCSLLQLALVCSAINHAACGSSVMTSLSDTPCNSSSALY